MSSRALVKVFLKLEKHRVEALRRHRFLSTPYFGNPVFLAGWLVDWSVCLCAGKAQHWVQLLLQLSSVPSLNSFAPSTHVIVYFPITFTP